MNQVNAVFSTDSADRYTVGACDCGGTIITVVVDTDGAEVRCHGCGKNASAFFGWAQLCTYEERDAVLNRLDLDKALNLTQRRNRTAARV